MQGSRELDDEFLNEAFLRIKTKIGRHKPSQRAFYNVRDDISKTVNHCSDNIKVVVYFDHFFDEPLIVTVGPGENRLRITIGEDGSITYSWTRRTWTKLFFDVLDTIRSVVSSVVSKVFKTASLGLGSSD